MGANNLCTITLQVMGTAELGDIDLEQWVIENTERVQNLREKAVVNYEVCSHVRKKWDKKVNQRTLTVVDLVIFRRAGMCEKLSQSWIGLYRIVKFNSLSLYHVDVGTTKKQSVHIQRLKRYEERKEKTRVKRVITVSEPDIESESLDSLYSELTVSGQVQVLSKDKDIAEWVKEFSDILTKELGLTALSEFGIETGDSATIAQRRQVKHSGPRLPAIKGAGKPGGRAQAHVMARNCACAGAVIRRKDLV